ncbi:hypothetical protein PCYB_146360, partial [Plasmodium cynomolgi strain B]
MGRGLTKLLEISLFIGGFLVIWYVTGEKIFRKKKQIVKENILLILRHLCLEIYKVLNETSKTTKSVYDMIKNEPNTSIELNKLEEVLLNNGYKQRIEDVEKDVLKKFDVTVEDFYEELKNYEKDEDVQKALNSIKKMYHESLLGIQPKLPSINENISQDVILNLTSLIYKKKRKIYKEKIDSMIKKNQDFNLNTTFSNSDFFNKLQKSTEHVEEQVIKENQNLVPNLFTFKYLVNYYSDDINFVQRKKYLESKHGEKMIKILKVKKIKKKKKITKDNLSNNSFKSTPSQNSLTDHTSSDRNCFVTPPTKQDDVDNNDLLYGAGSDISAGNNNNAAAPYLEMIPSYHHVKGLYMGQDQGQDQDQDQDHHPDHHQDHDKFEPTAPLDEHIIDFEQSAQNVEEELKEKGEEENEEGGALLGVVTPSDDEVSPEGSPLSAQTNGGHANEGGDGWIHGEHGHEEGVDLNGDCTKIEKDAKQDDAEVAEDAEDGVGYPDGGAKTEEPSEIKEIDQVDTPDLNVQPEGEDDKASPVCQEVDPSAQVEEAEQDNQEAEKSVAEEGGAVNEELAQEENEPTNGEADEGKREDAPLPQQEDEGVAVEMVEAVKEELPTEEPSKEEQPAEEPSKEKSPAEEPSKEEPLAEEPSKE